MIKSMTGYGKKIVEFNNKKISVEIKALNSKQLDLATRLPGYFREKDIEIRNIIAQRLERGKIELQMFTENSDNGQNVILNKNLIKSYYNQLLDLKNELNVTETDIFQLVFRLPDSLKSDREEFDENEWKVVSETINLVIDEVNSFRKQEGSAMATDLEKHVDRISELLSDVQKPETERLIKIKKRIRENLNEFVQANKIDENRFEQELIYYIEKIDISEEKVRLKNHCSYFKEIMKTQDSSGKKLGFIAQEIGREVNTLGSKANDTDIQTIVIEMKDELEKIKEQVLNIL